VAADGAEDAVERQGAGDEEGPHDQRRGPEQEQHLAQVAGE
jgi:hypothetical protein